MDEYEDGKEGGEGVRKVDKTTVLSASAVFVLFFLLVFSALDVHCAHLYRLCEKPTERSSSKELQSCTTSAMWYDNRRTQHGPTGSAKEKIKKKKGQI